MKPVTAMRTAVLCLQDWAGYTEQPVVVVGETPKRYRVMPSGSAMVKLGGRARWLRPGKTALVPKRAVRMERA